MTSPFLPIVSSPSGLSPKTTEISGQTAKPSQGEPRQENVAFADVLGGTQRIQAQGDGRTDTASGEQPALFQELNEGDSLASLTAQISPQTPVEVEPISVQFSLSHHELTQQVLLKKGDVSRGSSQEPGVLPLVVPSGTGLEKTVGTGKVGQTILSPETLALGDRGQDAVPAGNQSIARLVPIEHTDTGVGGRIRPLLNEPTSAIPQARPILNSVPNAVVNPQVDVQQSLAKLEVPENTLQTNIGSLYAQSRLPQLPEEHASFVSRTDSDGKTTGSFGVSQAGEAGLGTAGGGLPFGNHAGNGQTQLFESSPGTQVSTGPSQVGVRAGTFDDRLQLLNASVPQRLQIDVQLSEAARVQVEVGVQQRQVYAGVLLDNPVLRSLAAQNIQVLEEQLEQADLELEEFDVHDGQLLNESPGQEQFGQTNFQGKQSEESGDSVVQKSQEKSRSYTGVDTGWHLVA